MSSKGLVKIVTPVVGAWHRKEHGLVKIVTPVFGAWHRKEQGSEMGW